ncbi:hypothetical protein EDD85DRAFT_855250 [Armillaria nabsnona]|nr:hypothetical protein EDD85DRAFT_855250 [Armillaria nabsnona]
MSACRVDPGVLRIVDSGTSVLLLLLVCQWNLTSTKIIELDCRSSSKRSISDGLFLLVFHVMYLKPSYVRVFYYPSIDFDLMPRIHSPSERHM